MLCDMILEYATFERMPVFRKARWIRIQYHNTKSYQLWWSAWRAVVSIIAMFAEIVRPRLEHIQWIGIPCRIASLISSTLDWQNGYPDFIWPRWTSMSQARVRLHTWTSSQEVMGSSITWNTAPSVWFTMIWCGIICTWLESCTLSDCLDIF